MGTSEAKLKGRLKNLSAEHLGPKLPHLTATASPQSRKLPLAGGWLHLLSRNESSCADADVQESTRHPTTIRSYRSTLPTLILNPMKVALHGIEDLSIHLLSGSITHPGSRHPITWVAWGTLLGFTACLMTKTPVQSTTLRVTWVHRYGWRRRRRKGIMSCVGAPHSEQGEPRSAGIYSCFS